MRWTWNGKEISIDGDVLTASDPSMQPSVRTFTLANAFEDWQLLFVHEEPAILDAILRALAARMATPTQRTAFWTHLAPGGPAPLKLEWEGATLEVGPRSASGFGDRPWKPLDDLFFHGPLAPGIPAETRARLIEHLLGALAPGSGLTEKDAFPRIDHARIPRRDWEWNKTDDGQEDATTGGPTVTVGYRNGHDYGWSAYPAERFLTRAKDVFFYAPKEIEEEIDATVRAAVV